MYSQHNPQTIQELFNSIAGRYDLTNIVLSFTMHKHWNHALVKSVIQPNRLHTLVDLCAGTGDIAFDYLKTMKIPCKACLVDFSSEMLHIAQKKAAQLPLKQHELSFIEADVQQLPLPDAYADCATVAYGIRNVQNPSRCIQDVFRVLKPGGCFGILELTRPKSSFLRLGHKIYMGTISPLLGKFIADNKQAYEYLSRSIAAFIEPEELENQLKEKGFIHTRCRPVAGGIATIILGYKPNA